MDALAEKERQKYERLWGSFPEYGESYDTPLANILLKYFGSRVCEGDSIIDFGCGSGRTAVVWLAANLKVRLVDFCDNSLSPDIFLLSVGPNPKVSFYQECLWSLPDSLKPADWFSCFDVLEHIPESKVEVVLKAISIRMRKGGLMSIALREDVWGKEIGEKLHLTVRPYEWWKERVSRYFSIHPDLYRHTNAVGWAVTPKEAD